MKLKEFQVTMYQSVLDSGVVDVGDVVCLVGKNEAGKTALLKALYKLNPIRPEDAAFSATDDYPRMEVSNYEESVAEGGTPDDAVAATYELSDSETEELSLLFGPSFLKSCSLRISKSYDNKRDFKLICDEAEAIKFMSRNLPSDLQSKTASIKTAHQFAEALELHAAEPAAAAIMPIVRAAKDTSYASYAFNTVLSKHEPKFLYFDEYYQMLGCENIEALKARLAKNMLEPQDQPLLGLIELAKLNLDKLLNPQSTQDLKNKLEGAGNYLTREIMRYWSQNKHLQMRFDVRPARPGDPERMRTGTNIWGEVYDTRHFVSTGLGTRSRGFVWFFSFVAWYSQIKHKKENVILLLDEPGLTLHGRAQGDLLRYFETELKPVHQLIYTTHSPFMVDPTHFDRVRIVQDLSIDVERLDDLPPEKQGTKVTQDIFDASDDSLFPLQGALGYDIHQTLFIGPNTLLVEGPADILFIKGMCALLSREGRECLSDQWTLTPVGGSGRIPTFVRLLTNQRGMLVATLIDIQDSDRTTIEGIYKDKLLKKANVRTFADYTGTKEADIEDMFDEDFYLNLINQEYKNELKSPLKAASFKNKAPRILKRIEDYVKDSGALKGILSHYRQARYFHENLEALAKNISSTTKDRFENAFKELNALLPR